MAACPVAVGCTARHTYAVSCCSACCAWATSGAHGVAPCSTFVSLHALGASTGSATAARVVSGTGSPENTQGSAVQTPWPSNDEARSTSTTLVTWGGGAAGTAPALEG